MSLLRCNCWFVLLLLLVSNNAYTQDSRITGVEEKEIPYSALPATTVAFATIHSPKELLNHPIRFDLQKSMDSKSSGTTKDFEHFEVV